ncbi:glycosyltransferase family 2 protein [Methylovulum miyakonense]|uniref:glycosyltransferase family 2 protein n=1 Tax=Methylovulum miyakonense TaxID=645578 RepID=UPI00038113AA|nr:glycosyltransferase family 2 protein [Methylovulum miyakonense]
MKIKLVAIAKDEAAYLPEWIFHHFFFGFDEIEVYVNFTSDNTYKVLEKIQKNFPVKFKNAEYLIEPENDEYDVILNDKFLEYNRLQSRAFAEAYVNAKDDGFTHVMFLDVDEFWTPLCFSKSIKNVLVDMGDPDRALFRWKGRLEEIEEFERPFKKEILYLQAKIPKFIVKTGIEIKILSTHLCGVIDKNRKAISPNGDKNAFILHRFQRSEMEYISLLGRGDPSFAGTFGLKPNRPGYIGSVDSEVMAIDGDLINKYDDRYQDFLKMNDIFEDIQEAKTFVLKRSKIVLNYIQENHNINKIAKKVVRGLTLNKQILLDLNQTRELSRSEILTLKGIALELEKDDLKKAYELMKIAGSFRPQMQYYKNKLKQYALALEKEQSTTPP